MQPKLDQPTAYHNALVRSRAELIERQPAGSGAARVGIGALWRDTLSTFSTHPLPVLIIGIIGFAGPLILGLSACAMLQSLKPYLEASSPLATYAGFVHVFVAHDKIVITVLLLQSILGLLGISLARGAISWIALSRLAGGQASLSTAIRVAVVRLPSLIAGSLLYGALMAVASMGVSATLRNTNIDLTQAGEPVRGLAEVGHKAMLTTINSLIPDPGSPLAEFLPGWRLMILGHGGPVAYSPYLQQHPPQANGERIALMISFLREPWFLVCGAMALTILLETLLRFRSVEAVLPSTTSRLRWLGALAPMLNSMRFGFKHFGLITLHVWALRLVFAGLSALLVFAPMVIVQSFVIPFIARATGFWQLYTLCLAAMIAGLALVNALGTAFATVYDARLYAALTQPLLGPALALGARPMSG